MSSPVIHLIATGVANVASVRAAFGRVGCTTRLIEVQSEIASADFLVLPGVGAFAAAARTLREQEWTEALRERVAADRPTLAICLGMQLLGSRSEEAPGIDGVGCVSVEANRFSERSRVPHMGWNNIVADAGCEILTTGVAYFAHSYSWPALPAGWRGATTDHGGPFIAAVERGNVVACQFHPELSAQYGEGLIRRWLQKGGGSC